MGAAVKIYEARHPLRYKMVRLPEEDGLAFFEIFEGSRAPQDAPPVTIVHGDRGPLKACEVFQVHPLMVMTAEAWHASETVLSPYGRKFSVQCTEAEMVAYDVVQVLDVLDAEASQIVDWGFKDMIRVDAWAFYGNRLPDRAVFRIPQAGVAASIFATEAIVRDLARLQLRGLLWEPVWDSELGSLTSS